MRTPSQHILFIATEYAAGMRPYADTIIHSLWQQGDHVLIVAKDDTVKHDFDDLPADSVTWVDYPASKLKKLAFRFRPSQLIRKIEELVTEHGLQLIYCLTGELVLAGSCKRLQRLAPLLYTIHAPSTMPWDMTPSSTVRFHGSSTICSWHGRKAASSG